MSQHWSKFSPDVLKDMCRSDGPQTMQIYDDVINSNYYNFNDNVDYCPIFLCLIENETQSLTEKTAAAILNFVFLKHENKSDPLITEENIEKQLISLCSSDNIKERTSAVTFMFDILLQKPEESSDAFTTEPLSILISKVNTIDQMLSEKFEQLTLDHLVNTIDKILLHNVISDEFVPSMQGFRRNHLSDDDFNVLIRLGVKIGIWLSDESERLNMFTEIIKTRLYRRGVTLYTLTSLHPRLIQLSLSNDSFYFPKRISFNCEEMQQIRKDYINPNFVYLNYIKVFKYEKRKDTYCARRLLCRLAVTDICGKFSGNSRFERLWNLDMNFYDTIDELSVVQHCFTLDFTDELLAYLVYIWQYRSLI